MATEVDYDDLDENAFRFVGDSRTNDADAIALVHDVAVLLSRLDALHSDVFPHASRELTWDPTWSITAGGGDLPIAMDKRR